MSLLTESDRPAAIEAAGWESQLGSAIRRWCAPALGMEVHVEPATYLEHRLALTNQDAAATLLPAAGVSDLLVDTGIRPGQLLDLPTLGALALARVWTIVRLEWLAEEVVRSGVGAAGYPDAYRDALGRALETALGCKTIVAYRWGLDVDPEPPSESEVATAAGAWLRSIASTGVVRLTDPVLLRFGIWHAVRTGRPLQVHVGYGDTDLELHRADPALLTRFLRATETLCPVMLLHTYPFQRTAGYLAQVFGHVYLDVGLAVNHTGAASDHIIRESLELAPLRKVLFSSDAWGIPELHLLGSWLFRRGLSRVLGTWVTAGDWSLADARSAIEGIANANAGRVYGLRPER
jgi:predicted TIM-barrel fold metal-dependent hydrolase